MNIFIYNPEVNDLEKTSLSSSTASGATVFKVKNSDRFAQNDKVLVGEMSRERSEILAVSTLTAVQLTLGAALFPHDADDPIYKLEYDKIKVYRSTTVAAGPYTLLDTIDIDVDNAEGKTIYKDDNALSTYWYKMAFYDSVNDEESDSTDPIAAGGYSEKALGTIIPEVAKQLGDSEFVDMSIESYIISMNDINDDLITQAKRPYRFLKVSDSLDISANSSTVDFPDDLWKVNYLEVNQQYAVTRPKKVSPTEARFQLASYPTAGDYIDGMAYDDEANQIIFYPKSLTERIGAFNLHYYKKFTRFTSLADSVQTPNTLIYKLGLKRDFYLKKADEDSKYLTKATLYDKRYNSEVMKLQREKNIEASGPDGLGPDRKRYLQWSGRAYRQ